VGVKERYTVIGEFKRMKKSELLGVITASGFALVILFIAIISNVQNGHVTATFFFGPPNAEVTGSDDGQTFSDGPINITEGETYYMEYVCTDSTHATSSIWPNQQPVTGSYSGIMNASDITITVTCWQNADFDQDSVKFNSVEALASPPPPPSPSPFNDPGSGRVVIPNTPPTVRLTSPTNGSIVAGTIELNAIASDEVVVAGVQFSANGSNIGPAQGLAPYRFLWNTHAVEDGNYTLRTIATDNGGLTAIDQVSIIIDNTSPIAEITNFPTQDTISGTIEISTNINDATQVEVTFSLDGAVFGLADNIPPYSTSLDTRTIANGNHIFTITARDAAGNETTDQVNFTVFNEEPDILPPVVSILSPRDGETVSGITTLIASASDDSIVAGVQFQIDGVNINVEDTVAPFSTNWNTAQFSDGAHTFSAVARDAAGNRTKASNAVIIRNTKPTPPPSALAPPPASTPITPPTTEKSDTPPEVSTSNISVVGNIATLTVVANKPVTVTFLITPENNQTIAVTDKKLLLSHRTEITIVGRTEYQVQIVMQDEEGNTTVHNDSFITPGSGTAKTVKSDPIIVRIFSFFFRLLGF
jgi:hypothetical protein